MSLVSRSKNGLSSQIGCDIITIGIMCQALYFADNKNSFTKCFSAAIANAFKIIKPMQKSI